VIPATIEAAMQEQEFTDGLLAFLAASPTPFHAVATMAATLHVVGFTPLSEAQRWQLRSPGRYFVARNGSSLIAFSLARTPPAEAGLRMLGAHTDSPCLKLKPTPELVSKSYLQLGVEVYGSALLGPWFDRDLSLAGRVSYVAADGSVRSSNLDFKRPIAVIPSLAIHLDREANNNRSINAQTGLPPIVMQVADEQNPDLRGVLLDRLLEQSPTCTAQRILDYELSLYDTQPPALVGLDQDFIAAARLDNLLSCYTGLMSLISAGNEVSCLLICNDHEEVGSASAAGAQGPFLHRVLERTCDGAEDLARAIHHSMLISADNAHGIHPNFADRHDARHGPILNRGPVIKVNANQRYASTSETAALFRHLCEREEIPVQSFVMRSDMACGSTLGPITATETGVRTLDVGVPTFAMHSIRELAGRRDAFHLHRVLKAFFSTPGPLFTEAC
jgi:aspartyl aminopeptidase